MSIAKRIFGVLFLLGGLAALAIAWMLYGDGNKHDAFSYGGSGVAAVLFSLVLFSATGKKRDAA